MDDAGPVVVGSRSRCGDPTSGRGAVEPSGVWESRSGAVADRPSKEGSLLTRTSTSTVSDMRGHLPASALLVVGAPVTHLSLPSGMQGRVDPSVLRRLGDGDVLSRPSGMRGEVDVVRLCARVTPHLAGDTR